MPIRIYALAKDLKIDSKDLAELCQKAGIPGKGSALASLEDDEVAKLKAYMEGSHKKSAPASPSAPSSTMERPRVGAPIRPGADKAVPTPAGHKPAVLAPTRKPVAPAAEISPEPAKVRDDVPSPPESTPVEVAATSTVDTPPVADVTPAKPPVAPPAPNAPAAREASHASSESHGPLSSRSTSSRGEATRHGEPAAREPITPAREGGRSPNRELPSRDAGPSRETTENREVAARDTSAKQPPARDAGPKELPQRDDRPQRPSREDFGSRGKGPIRVIDRGAPRGDATKKKDDGGPGAPPVPRAPREREPAIRLAAMPNVKQPEAKPAAGPAAMKPTIRLKPDALKTGAPLANVLKNLEKPKADAPGNRKGKGPAAPGDMPPVAPGPGDKARAKKVGGRDEEVEVGGGMDAIRKERQKNRIKTPGSPDDESEFRRGRKKTITRIKGHTSTAPRKGKVQIELPCTVREFCEQAGITSAQVMKVLMGMGMMININAPIPDEYVELISAELGLDLEIKPPESLEDKHLKDFTQDEDPAHLQIRPPIVTFLGHVDHGKTSLLDRIIGINVVAGEAGGITQHIRAYAITTKSGRKISFVDTPGHEAFTEMRARGANVTDIAVLVVAADDGVMRQTEEAISHAKAANVPIVVAMNKIDLPGANPQRVLEQLAANELLPSEWGGEVEVVRTSAMTGQGMDDLLETLLITADLHEYKANPDRAATGTCLEAEQEPGRGVIAKVIVRNGTLKEGDIVVCGAAHGRVKAMYDTLDARKRLKEAGPSIPVNLTGFDIPPNAGDVMYVLDDIAAAREIAAERATNSRERSLSGVTKRVSLEDFQRRLAEGMIGREQEKVTLNLIIRADVRGSIEAIQNELSKFDHPEVQIRVLQASVGGISVADVTLASASDAVIVGFNVIPDEAARGLAEDRQVEIRRYDIIYKLTDDIKAMLEGKLKPEEKIIDTGRVVVKQVFNISRVGVVAGCYVIQGNVERSSRIRVFRDGRMVGDYAIDTLRREKDDVKEVSRGMECGIKLLNFNDIKQDDVLEVYKIEEVARTL